MYRPDRPKTRRIPVATRATAVMAFLLVLAGGVSGSGDPAFARGLGAAGDVERARANARAGGPVSEYDADLLRRYGCHSGTENPICKPWNARGPRKAAPKAKKHRKR